MSWRINRLPRIRKPSSSGDSKKIENTIKPNTAAITSNAIKIPRQFL